MLALLLTGLAALATTKPFRRGVLAVMLLWGGAYSSNFEDLAAAAVALVDLPEGFLWPTASGLPSVAPLM